MSGSEAKMKGLMVVLAVWFMFSAISVGQAQMAVQVSAAVYGGVIGGGTIGPAALRNATASFDDIQTQVTASSSSTAQAGAMSNPGGNAFSAYGGTGGTTNVVAFTSQGPTISVGALTIPAVPPAGYAGFLGSYRAKFGGP